MKLVVAVVDASDSDALLRALSGRGYGATLIDSNGGFLRQGNATLLVGVQESMMADVLHVVSSVCQTRQRLVNPSVPLLEPATYAAARPLEELTGGASIFVLNVDRYERIA